MMRYLMLVVVFLGLAFASMAPTARAEQVKVQFCPGGLIFPGWGKSAQAGSVTAGCQNGFLDVPAGGGGGGSGGGSGGGAIGGGGSSQTSASTTPAVDKKNS